ncbi:beta strand repeat-containing protein [Nostoc sp.]|uniref:beta strand repeat-containing protein n=1 Tax=Nostoc sp. TaxID=1180 RepID=UPI002FF90A3A
MSTFTVTNTNNSGAGSLRQAVLDANALTGKDIINFGGLFTDGLAHTISLTGSSLSITDDLTIEGTNPSLLTIKDDSVSRVFDIGSSVTSAINGVTITNSYNDNEARRLRGLSNDTISDTISRLNIFSSLAGGGAISIEGSLTLNNSIITGNTAEDGGGISNYGGSLTLNNSIITGNTAKNGGGIINSYFGGTITVNNTTISGNTALYGGGIDSFGDTYAVNIITVNNSIITGNTAENGGGINSSSVGFGSVVSVVSVNNSTISGNTASYGGGINSSGDTITVNNSTISGNTASYGGGIKSSGDTITVNNSTISGNTASNGGGINLGYGYGGIFTLINSTISGNQAHFGGGIYNEGTLTVGNSIIRHNKAFGMEFGSGQEESGKGGGIYNYNSRDATVTLDYSTIACNFDTPQKDSNKVIKPDDLVGKFITKYDHNRIGNLSGSTFSYS